MKKWCISAIALCLTMLIWSTAQAASVSMPQWAAELRIASPGGHKTSAEIRVQPDKDGNAALFLPSCMDLSALTFVFESETLTFANEAGERLEAISGQPADVGSLFPSWPDAQGRYSLTVSMPQGDPLALYLMRSANQAAIWVVSGEPETHGRAYVDASSSSEKRSITGSMLMLDADGRVIYDDDLRELRGRGNTTWGWGVKKPYQIKLKNKADLLNNERNNTARTWVLLAEAFDATGLHNTISLSLGKAMGLEGTPEARMVDLYFDGEYRGYYLLSEKVQVNEARLNMLNYSDYLAELNPNIEDREAFPLAKSKNRFGCEYQYVENVITGLARRGAYLVELDQYNYKREANWFVVNDRDVPRHFVIKTPEFAPAEDVSYVSERMQELVDAVYGGGINPTTGKHLSEYLDYDSMARVLLINELAKTCDYAYTSTFFYLPLDSNRFYAGPLWDFDIAYSIRDNRLYEVGVDNYIPYEGWLRELMTVPDFQLRMKELYTKELEPLVRDVLLGEQEKLGLYPINKYVELRKASRQMNERLWEYGGGYNNMNWDTLYPTYEENFAFFVDYLTARIDWLKADMALWSGSEIVQAGLTLSYVNAKVADTATVSAANIFPHYEIEATTFEEEPSEHEPWRHIYTAMITLKAKKAVPLPRK